MLVSEPDTPNLSDAILLALRNYGWIGPVVRKGAHVPTVTFTRIRKQRRSVPVPVGLVIPEGVTWNQQNGRFYARIWVGRHPTVNLGACGPVQEDLDRLGALWKEAVRLRTAGASAETIRTLLVKEAA